MPIKILKKTMLIINRSLPLYYNILFLFVYFKHHYLIKTQRPMLVAFCFTPISLHPTQLYVLTVLMILICISSTYYYDSFYDGYNILYIILLICDQFIIELHPSSVILTAEWIVCMSVAMFAPCALCTSQPPSMFF